MEETPINVDHLFVANEDDIRLSGKITLVKSVTKT